MVTSLSKDAVKDGDGQRMRGHRVGSGRVPIEWGCVALPMGRRSPTWKLPEPHDVWFLPRPHTGTAPQEPHLRPLSCLWRVLAVGLKVLSF